MNSTLDQIHDLQKRVDALERYVDIQTGRIDVEICSNCSSEIEGKRYTAQGHDEVFCSDECRHKHLGVK